MSAGRTAQPLFMVYGSYDADWLMEERDEGFFK